MKFSKQYLNELSLKTNFIKDNIEKVLRLTEILKYINYESKYNSNAYPYDINEIEIDGTKVMIASREKALTDMLSKISPRNNKKELLDLLFEDLRIDEVIFDELDKCKLIKLCDLYSSKTLHILKKYLDNNYLKI